MTKRLFYILLPLSLLSLSCNWTPISQLGEKVRLLGSDEVKTCTKKGQTTVSVKYEILGVARKQKTIAEELVHLARNTAPDLNGDTVVVASPIKNGQRTFDVYKCIDPLN